MNTHQLVSSVIDNTGLKFTDNGNNFTSVWKIGPQQKITVIVAYDIHPEWVHIFCNIGQIEEYASSISIALLRLNNSIIGTKFSLENNYNILCTSEISLENLSEDNLKQRITQVVKMVTLFYENVEKENLKLNST